jgi:exodeoxyribonuclease VII large subunit
LLQDRVPRWLQTTRRELSHSEKTIELLNPANVLRRGFSITYHQDQLLTDPDNLQNGDTIRTVLANGEVISIVASPKK